MTEAKARCQFHPDRPAVGVTKSGIPVCREFCFKRVFQLVTHR
jgi:hypothetical protein